MITKLPKPIPTNYRNKLLNFRKTSISYQKNLLNFEYAENANPNVQKPSRKFEERYSIVLEGKSGETSVAEICRRENIDQDTFLSWTKEFLKFIKDEELSTDRKYSKEIRKYRTKISSLANKEVFDYLSHYFDFSKLNICITKSRESSTLNNDFCPDAGHIINFLKINNFRYINKYFEQVNSKLDEGALFAGCLETFSARKTRKWINGIPILNHVYFSVEFLLKRVLPKLAWSKKLYFDMTKGNDRLLSKAEGLGRLVSCGFKIIDVKNINGLIYFVVKKESKPQYDMSPSYGPLYKMPRIGKNGQTIKVYKFRTMHPYSEYLQDYIIRAHGYSDTGKPANDFRVPEWGKIMRRFWLDELPQLINVLKGDMKLVGIRPVSKRYFEDIPKEMQKLRLTQKPGCIPPYVALNRDSNVMSVLQAEKDYLIEKINNPYTTDVKYFFSAIFNILFKNKRSA